MDYISVYLEGRRLEKDLVGGISVQRFLASQHGSTTGREVKGSGTVTRVKHQGGEGTDEAWTGSRVRTRTHRKCSGYRRYRGQEERSTPLTFGKTMQLRTNVSGASVTSVARTVTLICLVSCSGSGSPSTLAQGPIVQFVPTILLSTQACFSSVEPSMTMASLTRTPSPTLTKGPIATLGPILADGAMVADGSM